jgi:3-hydroxyacyl-CoA dehydrogenase
VHGRVLIVSVDNAPANALGAQVRTQLRAAIETADTNPEGLRSFRTFR